MIPLDTVLNGITARRIGGIKGFNHYIQNVQIKGINPSGLGVQGLWHDLYENIDYVVYSTISADIFWYWYFAEKDRTSVLNLVPEQTRLNASYTVWEIKKRR